MTLLCQGCMAARVWPAAARPLPGSKTTRHVLLWDWWLSGSFHQVYHLSFIVAYFLRLARYLAQGDQDDDGKGVG